MTPRQILIEARQLLVDKGWVPHEARGGPYCMRMAVHDVPGKAIDHRAALIALGNAVYSQESRKDWKDLYGWNDSQTSIEPILAAFDRAIASLSE